MSNLEATVSEFSLVGELLELFSNERQEIEAIDVAAGDRRWHIKLSKKLQLTLDMSFRSGNLLEIRGTSRKNPKTGRMTLKAKYLQKTTIDGLLVKPTFTDIALETSKIKENTVKEIEKTSILVCSKSKCWKRGGKDICQLLKENVRDRGWQEKVTIETTSCLKQCKYAPNLIMMPDKTCYSEVSPKEIPLLLERHLSPLTATR
jgi:(2Fe-2S) ferredoxin